MLISWIFWYCRTDRDDATIRLFRYLTTELPPLHDAKDIRPLGEIT